MAYGLDQEPQRQPRDAPGWKLDHAVCRGSRRAPRRTNKRLRAAIRPSRGGVPLEVTRQPQPLSDWPPGAAPLVPDAAPEPPLAPFAPPLPEVAPLPVPPGAPP